MSWIEGLLLGGYVGATVSLVLLLRRKVPGRVPFWVVMLALGALFAACGLIASGGGEWLAAWFNRRR